MQLIKECRTRAAMCRAQSVSDPRHREIWLAEERAWLRKADEEIASHFKECNIAPSSDLAAALCDLGDKKLMISALRAIEIRRVE